VGEGFDGFVEFQEFGGFHEAVAGGDASLEFLAFFNGIECIEDDVIRIAGQDIIHIMFQVHGAFPAGDMGIHNTQEIEKGKFGIERDNARLFPCKKASGRDIVLEPKPDLYMGMIECLRLHGIDNGTHDPSFLENAQKDEDDKEKTQGVLKAKGGIAGFQKFKGIEQSLLKEEKKGDKHWDHEPRKRHPVAAAKDDEQDLRQYNDCGRDSLNLPFFLQKGREKSPKQKEPGIMPEKGEKVNHPSICLKGKTACCLGIKGIGKEISEIGNAPEVIDGKRDKEEEEPGEKVFSRNLPAFQKDKGKRQKAKEIDAALGAREGCG